MNGRQRIFVALDTPDPGRAAELAAELAQHVGGFKVGLELFAAAGPSIVETIRDRGADLFVDLKLHDIPNTVAGAAASVARLGARFLTLHAIGGASMLRRGVDAAREAATAAGFGEPTVLAVTVLTSMDDAALRSIGIEDDCPTTVSRLAKLAQDAGVGGLVCSPLEVPTLRRAHPESTLMVPGIRPASGNVRGDDQSRTAAPARTVQSGADYLVIGRPITAADDPRAAADAIADEIDRLA